MTAAQDVLAEHLIDYDYCSCGWRMSPDTGSSQEAAAHVLDALRAARVAVIPLPEPDEDGDFRYGPYSSYVFVNDGEVEGKHGAQYGEPPLVREFAAALLAAAAAAEEQQ